MPLIYGIFGSFRKYTDFMYHTESFLPSNWDAFTFEGYSELFSKTEFVKENAYLVPTGYAPMVDYIKIVDKIYFKGE
mgnify:CR=1 FL=1